MAARAGDRPADGPGAARARARVTEALRAAIVTGDLAAGGVYSAPRLAARFGVSPTPVREAMLDLVRDGLVRTIPNRGFQVVEPSPAALHDILELRLLLEVPVVVRLAERGLRDAELAALRPLAEQTLRAASAPDVVAHVVADLAFHLALLDQWGNTEITEVVRALRSRSRLAGLRSADNHAAMVDSAREHLELLDLLRRRDAAAAGTLMAAHLRRAADLWDPTPGGTT